MLRWVAWIAACAIALVLLVRAAVIAGVVPYAIWKGFREGGYPGWAQALAVAVVVGTMGYIVYRSVTEARRRD